MSLNSCCNTTQPCQPGMIETREANYKRHKLTSDQINTLESLESLERLRLEKLRSGYADTNAAILNRLKAQFNDIR